ncbi:hypothetical protein MMC32_002171 [Xylographa parallela]|nr:hypothetical protein [Xylographa parallela]
MPVIILSQRQNEPTIISGNPPASSYLDAVVFNSPDTNASTIVGIIIVILLAALLGIAIWWLIRRVRKLRAGGVQNRARSSQSVFRIICGRGRKKAAEAGPSAEVYRMSAV